MTDGLKKAHREAITALIAANDRVERAVLFGSRATGTETVSSDVDIALFGSRLTLTDQARLAAAIDEIPMAQSVDLLLHDSIRDRTLRKHIRVHGVEWYARPPRRKESDASSESRSEWPVVTVENLSEKVAMGPFGSSIKVSTFVPDGVPIISGQHLHDVRVDDAPGFNFITHEHAKRLANANVRRGDVIFTHAGNIGQVAYVPECSRYDRYVISQRQFYMRCDSSKAVPEFVARYFTSAKGQHQLLANASQVGVPSIAQPVSYLRTLQVPLPPLSEQRTIAHILGTMDDKIELKRRVNATLEAMARALFRSWFVDFDPVRAKMEGRDTGLPKEIADLFPDRLVDSELGEIPQGWRVSTIGTEVDAVGGATPSTKDPAYWDGGQHHWATPKDLSKLLSPVLLETDRRITDAGAQKISSGLLPPGTVLLSSRAPIGYLAINEVPTAINQGFIAMICRKRLPAVYVLFWCYENLEHIKDISGGSTFAEISKKVFRPLPIVVPPKRILGVYDEASRSLYDRVVSNTKESVLLASLRDALLPKLVSGELRVSGLGPASVRDERPAAVGTS